MHFYNLTIKQASAISHACVGQFMAKRDDYKMGLFEIAVAKGRFLEILKPDIKTGKLNSIISVNVFGIIRSMAAFRLTGGFKDYLVIGSESGRIVILEYLPDKNKFVNLHQETFGRSGLRRIVAGQHLACDSRGRAVMIGAMEKQKLVYQLNRDTQANLTISSPLEANKSNTFVFYMINIDVGYENPLFACLELDYEEADDDTTGQACKDTKLCLTYYELDLGLNHVVRKYSEELESHANYLIQVPGGDDGPSGILVCFENYIVYKNFGEQDDIKIPIPRRKGETDIPGRGILISCSATHKYLEGDKRRFCFYIQTELGDIFKTDFMFGGKKDELVTEIRMVYFDTLPVATNLCLLPHSRRHLEGGLLFVSAEACDHNLYQVKSVEDEEDTIVFSSNSYANYMAANETAKDDKFFQFKPTELRHLEQIDQVRSLAPALATTPFNHSDEHRLLMTAGSKKNSTLRVLRHGLEVSKGDSLSSIHSNPTGIWSIRKSYKSTHDDYVVVSFSNATLVLDVSDEFKVIPKTGFDEKKPTIGCGQIGDDSIIQIHPDGIRHISADKRVSEWKVGIKYKVLKCAFNNKQVAIYSSERELIYFDMDKDGQLNEFNERRHFTSELACLALNQISSADLRSRFLAVGFELKVLILSLDLSDCLSEITRLDLPSAPESICITELGAFIGNYDAMSTQATNSKSSQLYLNVGLQNGELIRCSVDRLTGDLGETPIRRFLGIRPVKLHNVRVKDKTAVLASTSKTWLLYNHQNRAYLSPLSCETFEHVASVSSPELGDCIVANINKQLMPLYLEGLGEIYNHQLHSLDATPRKFVLHPESGNVIVLMTDRLPLLIDESDEDNPDRWQSQIQLMDPITGQIYRQIKYESHQAALCIALASFGTSSTTIHVGIANNYKLMKQTAESNEILTYSLTNRSCDLELLHKTPCDSMDIPRAMCELQDRLVVGVGRIVRVYDLGKKKLLRKCESKQIPYMVSGITCISNRLFVSDIQESFTFMMYRKNENTLNVFADDTYPRYLVSSGVVDTNSVAGGDKFGNICVLELPEDCNTDQNDDPTGARSLWDRGWLGGASQKANVGAITYLGEIVTSIQRVSLTLGRAECLLYTTICGTIGALIPLDDTEFEHFQTLEGLVREEIQPLCGRDHIAFCSTYFPTKNIVDGHMCESFLNLDEQCQQKIADDMQKRLHELTKSLDEMMEKII